MSISEHRASSAPVEDYVKAIYSLTHRDGSEAASTSELADRLQITAGSVSTMLKRMDTAGTVEHVPYRGVRLTAAGERLALGVLRRHRLIEQFLHQALDIPWDDVDRFAERLEHAVSDELIEIIAAKLGHPTVDPHGDPIPNADLELADQVTRRLDQLEPGTHATFVRISDRDPEMLRYLAQREIKIGDELHMVAVAPFDGPIEIRAGDTTHTLGLALARAIRVR